MKVAMIGQKGIAISSGGVERHVEEISKRLVAKGYDVTAYYRNTAIEKDINEYEGIKLKKVVTIKSKSLDAIVYSLKATFNAIREGYDIYHYHALGPASVSIIPKILGKKVIVTVHGLDWQRKKWGKFAKLYLKFGEFITGEFADKIISVSNTVTDYIIKKYHRTKGDVKYIPNGVDISAKYPPDLIRKYGLKEDNYILFLARLVPEKGAHYLIEAFNDLNVDAKLVIAGGSSFTDGYVEKLRSMAEGNKNIIFTGNVRGKLLKELYSNCLFYVLPSDIEGMPLTLLEAFSYGKFAVVSDIPENKSVIEDKYGLTFRKSSVEDLKDKLNIMFNNIPKFKAKENECIQNVIDNYDWEEITNQVIEVYKECKAGNE